MSNYTTVASLQTFLGLQSTRENEFLQTLITQVSALFDEYLDRQLGQQSLTEYVLGNGETYIALQQRPIYQYQFTGTLHSTTTVTGLASTSNLSVGMPVVAQNDPTANILTPGTTIASIVSSSSVTLSQAALVAGSYQLFFGLAIWQDDNALWNQAEGAFAADTQLIPGQDYALKVDQADGGSRCGLVYNANGYWDAPFTYTPGVISPALGPFYGNIMVQYTAGYGVIPAQIEMACNMAISKFRNLAGYGQALVSENYEEYNYALANQLLPHALSPEVRSMLARYKNVAVA
jgi:hypothetical protein